MRTSTLGRVVKPVNAVDSDPFHNVTSSRFASDEMGCVAPAFLPSSVAGHNNNFPVSNPTAGGTNDKEEVRKNEIGQQTCNNNGQVKQRSADRKEFPCNGLALPQSGKVPTPATPNKEASLLPPTGLLPIARPVRSRAPALSLLMILERSPR